MKIRTYVNALLTHQDPEGLAVCEATRATTGKAFLYEVFKERFPGCLLWKQALEKGKRKPIKT